jgi:hypothetical protein
LNNGEDLDFNDKYSIEEISSKFADDYFNRVIYEYECLRVDYYPNLCFSNSHEYGNATCNYVINNVAEKQAKPGGNFIFTRLSCANNGGGTQQSNDSDNSTSTTNTSTNNDDPSPSVVVANPNNNPITSLTNCTGDCIEDETNEEEEEEEEQCNTYNESINANNNNNASVTSLSKIELLEVIESPLGNNIDKIQAVGEYFSQINSSFNPFKEALAGVSNNSNLSQSDLYIISTKTKEIYDILKPHEISINSLIDIDHLAQILTPQELQIVETNFLITSFFPSLKDLYNDYWPQNAEEWNEFGEFLITALLEIVPELIPGVAEVIAIKDAFNNFNNGEYISASSDLSLALIGIFPIGKLFKIAAKFVKGIKIVVRLSKSFAKAKKMRNAISNSLDEALPFFEKIGCAGNEGVRVLGNSSKKQGKAFFDLLTKNGTDITNQLSNPPTGLIVKKMSDGSKIQYRSFSSTNNSTEATIDFLGGNYSNKIQKIKFNN